MKTEINTQEEFWIEISKCNMDKDKTLSLLMETIASMLPTEKQLEERAKGFEEIRRKSKQIDKAIKERRNKFPQIFGKLDKLEIKESNKWCHTQEERHHECNLGCKNDKLLCCFCGSFELCDSCQNSIT